MNNEIMCSDCGKEMSRGEFLGHDCGKELAPPAHPLPEGWSMRRINESEIVVEYISGSGVVVYDDEHASIATRLFYRLASDILDDKPEIAAQDVPGQLCKQAS